MAECSMTNRDVLLLYRVLKAPEVGDLRPSPRFAYAVARNKQRLEPLIKALAAARTPPPEVRAYEEARGKLITQFAVQRDGQPVRSPDGEHVLLDPARESEFEIELAALNAKYPDAPQRVKELTAQVDKLMDEPADFVPYQVALADMPEGLSTRVYDSLIWMVARPEAPTT